MPPDGATNETNRYKVLIEKIFLDRWKRGATEVEFRREDIAQAARKLRVKLPKNLGDLTYSFRYRISLPQSLIEKQPAGLEWIIEGAGRAKYRFRLVPAVRIRPREDMAWIALPDSTPEAIRHYALNDEQALLAIVRYNRLIDTFLGLTTWSLQNHLRTTVKDIGQIEIDELYIGLDKHGCHYAIPVQAKGRKDQIGVVQIAQDIRWVEQRFPGIRCRPVAAQFMAGGTIAVFELMLQAGEVRVVDERHYRLTPCEELNDEQVRAYRSED